MTGSHMIPSVHRSDYKYVIQWEMLLFPWQTRLITCSTRMLYEETCIYTGAETVTKLFLCLSAMLQVSCLKARNVIDDLWLKLADVVQADRHEKCPRAYIWKDVGIQYIQVISFISPLDHVKGSIQMWPMRFRVKVVGWIPLGGWRAGILPGSRSRWGRQRPTGFLW